MSYVDVINYAPQPITMLTLLILFLAVLLLFLYNYKNLLQTIILLELLTFTVLSFFSQLMIASPSSYHLIIVLFSLFIIEGLLVLFSLTLLVRFTGFGFKRLSLFQKISL